MQRATWRKAAGLALMAAVLTAAWAGAASAAEEPVLGAVSEEPLMVLRVASPTDLGTMLDETRVGRHLRQSPLVSSLVALGESGLRFGAALLGDVTEETLDRLLSREMALVVFPSAEPGVKEASAALVMHLGEDAELVRSIFESKAVPRAQAGNPRLSVTEESVGGASIFHFQDGPKHAYVRFAGDLLVAGSREALVKLGPAGPTPAWLAAEEPLAGLATSYLNLSALWDMMLARAPAHQQRGLRSSGLTAIGDVWASTDALDGGFKDTLVAGFRQEEGGFATALLAVEPAASRCASVVPRDYALLASVQIGSGETLYSLIEETVRQNEGEVGVQNFRAGVDQVDHAFAVNVEWELLPTIGSEAFLAVRAPAAEQMARGGKPRPSDLALLIGFAVQDRDALKGLVERFAASPEAAQMGWQLITEGYNGQDYHTLRNIAGPAGFSFAFVDGFVVGSKDAEALKPVLDAVASGEVLGAEPRYLAVSEHLPEVANVRAYVDSRPFREAALLGMERNAPPKARSFVPMLQEAVPDLGGYGLALVGQGDVLRVEGFGEVPAAFALFTLGALGGSVESQRHAGPPAGVVAPAGQPAVR